MKGHKPTARKNPEKKTTTKRGPVSKETMEKTAGEESGDKAPVSLFLEIIIPDAGEPGDAELILWSYHLEGARGSLAGDILDWAHTRRLIKNGLKIYDIHTGKSEGARVRTLTEIHKADDWSARIRDARRLHEARQVDRRRQVENARRELEGPADFDDLNDLVKSSERNEWR